MQNTSAVRGKREAHNTNECLTTAPSLVLTLTTTLSLLHHMVLTEPWLTPALFSTLQMLWWTGNRVTVTSLPIVKWATLYHWRLNWPIGAKMRLAPLPWLLYPSRTTRMGFRTMTCRMLSLSSAPTLSTSTRWVGLSPALHLYTVTSQCVIWKIETLAHVM